MNDTGGVPMDMQRRLLIPLGVMIALAASCHDRSAQPPPAPLATPSGTHTAPVAVASSLPTPAASSKPADPFAPAMRDGELGALVNALSEDTGEFPSDNFVSNETSFLHVASALDDDALRGKAYVGVGPEQNLTYVTMMRPRMAYVVDIRRGNLLEHMLIRSIAETSDNRATFLARLTSRDLGCCNLAQPELATVDEIADAIALLKVVPDRIEQEAAEALALMDRLGVKRMRGDERDLRKTLKAFADKGLDLAYTMQGSGRRYPKLRELLAMSDADGKQRSFVADEESFQSLRGMLRANRIVPVVGDFSGDRALRGVAADMKQRGLVLGVFYTSNVEQYLFEGGTYGKFVGNVEAFPIDDTSRFIRVWFDQGRAHPKQREGHRTTSVVMPVRGFLRQWGDKPFPHYWKVATTEIPFQVTE